MSRDAHMPATEGVRILRWLGANPSLDRMAQAEALIAGRGGIAVDAIRRRLNEGLQALITAEESPKPLSIDPKRNAK